MTRKFLHQPSTRRAVLLAVVLIVLAFPAARADTPIRLTRTIAPDARITISNVKGEVRISGWNRNSVQVDGTLGSGAKPLQIEGGTHALQIRVEAASKANWFGFSSTEMAPSVLDVHVPNTAALNIHVVSASVSVDGVAGATVAVNTVSGRVHLGVNANAVAVDSVSGDIDLSGSARSFNVQTVSGDVQAGVIGDSAIAQTVSGDVLLHGGVLRKVDLGTVSGELQLDAAIAPGAAWKIDTMSGDVRLGLPADASAQIKADTFSGDLRSDFGKPIESEHGLGEHLSSRIGGGNGSIVVNSFSGDVRIGRGDN